MKSYKIQLDKDTAFTCITDEVPDKVAAAIFERFRVMPLSVTAL